MPNWYIWVMVLGDGSDPRAMGDRYGDRAEQQDDLSWRRKSDGGDAENKWVVICTININIISTTNNNSTSVLLEMTTTITRIISLIIMVMLIINV